MAFFGTRLFLSVTALKRKLGYNKELALGHIFFSDGWFETGFIAGTDVHVFVINLVIVANVRSDLFGVHGASLG